MSTHDDYRCRVPDLQEVFEVSTLRIRAPITPFNMSADAILQTHYKFIKISGNKRIIGIKDNGKFKYITFWRFQERIFDYIAVKY